MPSKKIDLRRTFGPAVIVGVATGMIIQLVLLLAGTALILKGGVAADKENIIANAVRCGAVFIGACIGGLKAKRMYLQVCLTVAVSLMVIWLFTAIMILDVQITGVSETIFGLALSCVCAILVMFAKEKGRSGGHKKIRYR